MGTFVAPEDLWGGEAALSPAYSEELLAFTVFCNSESSPDLLFHHAVKSPLSAGMLDAASL